jgi:MFS family permease
MRMPDSSLLTDRRAVPFVALIAADNISRVGNMITSVAIPWLVLTTTGSAALTGLAVFANALPVVISLLFGGVIADRYSYRRVSIVGDLASGVTVAMIPVLDHTVGLAFWQLLVLVFLGTLLDIPAEVARYSALPELAAQAGLRLERATALSETVLTIVSLVAPALAGVLIAVFGASNVLILDALTFALAAVTVARFLPYRPQPAREVGESRGYVAEFKQGLRFIRHERLLFPLVVFFAAMNLAIGPIESVFVPVYADEVFGSSVALGLMAAANGGGALAGTLVFGAIGHRLSRRAVFFVGFACVPATLALLALTPALPLTLAVLAGFGVGIGLANVLEYTIYFERIPEGMRARVLGIAGAIGWGSVPLGRLTGGLLVEQLGLTTTLAALALACLPLPLLMLVVPSFRDMRAPEPAEVPDPATASRG